MVKRKRSSAKRGQTLTLQALLVGLALFLVLIVAYGLEGALEFLGIDTGGDGVAGTALPEGDVTPITGGGAYFSVYFTSPVIPFDDVTEGGIENNLIELINNAQTSVDGAMFEFDLQNVDDALIAAHNRGVRVRIVYDDEHTEEAPQMEELIDAGIPSTPDERTAFMHNKFFVIDGQIVWLGSWNVTLNDSYRNNNNGIVMRSTQLAQNYSTEFEEMFNGEFGPTSPANTPNPVFSLNGIRIENYFSPEDNPMPKLVEFVNTAQESIHFMAFSFTDDSLMQAMTGRAENGVEVVGVFEQRGANTEFSACPPMLGMGLDVRLDSNPRTFHHKVIIVDGRAVAIGSFNFSANAADSNDENLVMIHDPAVAALYEQEFNKQYTQAVLPVGGECLTEEE